MRYQRMMTDHAPACQRAIAPVLDLLYTVGGLIMLAAVAAARVAVHIACIAQDCYIAACAIGFSIYTAALWVVWQRYFRRRIGHPAIVYAYMDRSSIDVTTLVGEFMRVDKIGSTAALYRWLRRFDIDVDGTAGRGESPDNETAGRGESPETDGRDVIVNIIIVGYDNRPRRMRFDLTGDCELYSGIEPDHIGHDNDEYECIFAPITSGSEVAGH